MKEVIEKLVEIENKAHHIIDNASSEKLRIEREKKEELEKYRRELETDRLAKLEELKGKCEAETKPEIEKVYQEGNQQLSDIENRFVKEKDKMAEEVFKRIIGA